MLSNNVNRIYTMMIDIQGNEKYACRSLAHLSLTSHFSNILIGTHSEHAHTVCLAAMKYVGLSIIELCGAAVAQTMACKQRSESNQPDGLLVGTWDPFWNQYYFNFGFPPGASFLDAQTPLNKALYPQAAKLVKALQLHSGDWEKINLLASLPSTSGTASSELKQHRQSHHNYTNYIIKKSKNTTSRTTVTIPAIPLTKSDSTTMVRKRSNKNFEILNNGFYKDIHKNINDLTSSSTSSSGNDPLLSPNTPSTNKIEALPVINPFDELYEDAQSRKNKEKSLAKNLVMRSPLKNRDHYSNEDYSNSNLLKVKINR